jgi:hypothetical protein
MHQKIQFKKVLIEYLRQADMFPISEDIEGELTQTGEYRYLCFIKTYYKEDDGTETPHNLLVPISAWLEFLKQIDRIFESKINGKLANRVIDQVVYELNTFPFPFDNDTLEECSNAVFEILLQHFELQVEALVPLYNIRSFDVLEIPLANTVLHSGHSSSLLANKISHPDIGQDLSSLRENCFLCVQATGDDESRLAQVEYESEQALKVLRFVTMWQYITKGNKQIRVNRATSVTTRQMNRRYTLYHKRNAPADRPAWHSDCPEPLILRKQSVDLARQHFGLDDLNYHYQNIDNPNSERVHRALELYDSGTRALTKWQALYRYVVSINVALPTSSSSRNELAKHLKILIKYGGNYVGTIKKDGSLSDPDTATWDELAKMAAEPFSQFYILRDKILHGNLMSDNEFSDEDLENARSLAHNAVRLSARVARELQWQTYREAKNWFKSPSYSPSVGISESNE